LKLQITGLRGVSFAAVALLAVPAMFASTATQTDKDFVAKVSQGGAYEVAASKLAETRAVALDVKDLALTEVHDHEGVGERLKAIAVSTGAFISPVPTEEFRDRLRKLKAVPAKDFDAAYIADMQAIHDKDEKLFAAEATQGSNDYKMFAHQTDMIVKRHIGALHGLDH
jgi:putative membrane protein